MADNASPFRFDEQPPVLQLVVSLFLVVVSGTLLFWLFVYTGSLIFGTEPQQMLLIPGQDAGTKANLLIRYVQVSQQVALFLIPSLVIIYMIRKRGQSFTGMDKFPKPEIVFLLILLAFFIIPVTSYTGYLNSKLDLPEWLSGIEEKIIAREEAASRLTELLITSGGAGSLIINIIIIAVIPAFCEELLFRGVLQQLLSAIFKSAHWGIWIAAIIFSSIHLQFFGFVPRLILGLSFGYLFYWTRTLWSSILAHFLNNVIPVVISYFTGWKALNDKALSSGSYGAAIPFISFLACCLIFYYLRRESLRGVKLNPSGNLT